MITADTETELELSLQQLETNSTASTLGRLAAIFEAQYNLGKGLGAVTAEPPRNVERGTPAVSLQQAAEVAAPQAAPAAKVAPAPPAAPAATGGFFSQGSEPEAPAEDAPMLAGVGPARLVQSRDPNKPWRAWADPRPRSVTDAIFVKTDDPDDPGLAAGTKKFWSFVR